MLKININRSLCLLHALSSCHRNNFTAQLWLCIKRIISQPFSVPLLLWPPCFELKHRERHATCTVECYSVTPLLLDPTLRGSAAVMLSSVCLVLGPCLLYQLGPSWPSGGRRGTVQDRGHLVYLTHSKICCHPVYKNVCQKYLSNKLSKNCWYFWWKYICVEIFVSKKYLNHKNNCVLKIFVSPKNICVKITICNEAKYKQSK